MFAQGVAVVDVRAILAGPLPRANEKVRTLRSENVVGGNAFVAALTAKLVGGSQTVRFMGALAPDAHGQALRDAATQCGVEFIEVLRPPPARTSWAYVAIEPADLGAGRTAFFHGGAIMKPTDIDAATSLFHGDERLVLFDGKFPQVNAHTLARIPHQLDWIVLDAEPKSPVTSDPSDIAAWNELFLASNVVVMNENSARMLLPGHEMGKEWARGVLSSWMSEPCHASKRLMVITSGERGSIAAWRQAGGDDVQIFVCPAHRPAKPIVDTCGAGDCFVGAICAGLLHGLAPPTLLKFASHVAGEKLQASSLAPIQQLPSSLLTDFITKKL